MKPQFQRYSNFQCFFESFSLAVRVIAAATQSAVDCDSSPKSV